MALYEYQCNKCGVLEIEQSVKDPALIKCPKCGSNGLIKLISKSSFQLKGSGWYKSDYGVTKNNSKEKK